MAYQLQYFDEVERDVRDAKNWLKEQKEGLEIEFAIAIFKIIERIVEQPELFALRYKNIRIAHPKKFQFNVYFYIDKPHKRVVIIAILHNKRNPKFVKKRI